MGTIVKFKPDMDYYYTRGIADYESDNFADAIKNFREAYNIAKSEESEGYHSIMAVEMACCYRNLNLLREAQLMYYKTLTDCDPDTSFDSVLGLIDIFITSDKEEAYKYYMDYAAKKGYSRELDFIETTAQFRAAHDFHVEPTPDRGMYNLGKKLMEIGQLEFARQLFETIPPDAQAYGDACVKLATLYNDKGEYEKALACAETVNKNSGCVESRVNAILALYKLGRTEEFEAAVAELDTVDEDVTGLVQIIHVMALVNNTQLVLKFGRKLVRISPQKMPMLCYAIALANSGELREARKTMVLLQALYPYDAAVRVFASLIARSTEKTDFSLVCEIPHDVEEQILSELNGVLSECENDRELLAEKLKSPSLRTGVLMVFQFGSENSKRLLCDVVAQIPFFEEYIRECLMDSGFPEADKRIMVPIAIKRLKRRPLYITCRDVCRPHYGKPPVKASAKWRDAYSNAYGVIAMLGCQSFEKEFNLEFGKLYKALGGESGVDETAVAAVLVSRMKVIQIIGDDESCIELFGANEENYYRYKTLSQRKKINKTKNNKGGNTNV